MVVMPLREATTPATAQGCSRVLSAVALAWGAQAIVIQSLLLREATVLMSGTELVWGIVLSAWLAGVAIGAWIGGRLSRRTGRARAGLAIVLLLLSLLSCASFWGFREARSFCGVGPGEMLSFGKAAIVAAYLVIPCGVTVGMAFPLAGAIRQPGVAPAHDVSINRIYAIESAGSLIGGALLTFWAIDHLSSIQTLLLCAFLTLLAVAVMMLTASAWKSGAVILLIAATAGLTAWFAGPALNQVLVQRRWLGLAPGYELVAETESRYQNLAVAKMAEQFTLYCDGQVAADFPDPITFVPLAHFWMCQHPDPRRVLVLGGAAEGILPEILRYPVEHVDCVEPDPMRIGLIEPLLPETGRTALADPRVTVHHLDGRLFAKTREDCFDVVIARLPQPTSALQARFYTREFFVELRRAMTDRAVLCLTASASPTRLPPTSAAYLAGVRNTIAAVFPEVMVGWGDPAHILAATKSGLISGDPAILAERYRQQQIESRSFDSLWFGSTSDWFAAEKVGQRAAELDAAAGAAVSTDLHPIVYLHRLALWEKMTAAHSRRFIERLLGVRWWHAATLLAGAAVAALLLHKALGRPIGEGVVVLSVGSSGFVTMSLSVVWLFAFQNLYGYVYQWIGWIIAVFMGGLVIGCAWAGWRSGGGQPNKAAAADRRQRLIAVDLLLAGLAGLAPLVLPLLATMQTSAGAFRLVQASVMVLVVATGVLGGAAFALASGFHRDVSGRPAATAGTIVGADHAGACIGALVTGLLLVPVFGITTAALLLTGVKLVSAGLLMCVRSHMSSRSPAE